MLDALLARTTPRSLILGMRITKPAPGYEVWPLNSTKNSLWQIDATNHSLYETQEAAIAATWKVAR